MLTLPGPDSEVGIVLASHLGRKLDKLEGHDLVGPCITCKSSDAFHLHVQTGVGHCFSCGGKWSPFQVAEVVLGNREQAKQLLVEIGLFKPDSGTEAVPADSIEAIARQKGVTANSLRAFGAKVVSPTSIQFPCYGPDGKNCTTFSMSTKTGSQANKGLFAKGRPAGLFFPQKGGWVRLPKPGEAWHLVEGVKDAAALQRLGLLACGLNTCRLAAKFARLFIGVEIVLVPDRDRAGEEGAQFTARVLRGAAKSVRTAVLPVEFKESGGEDVRDVLRRANGRDQILQAIADAQPPVGWESLERAQELPTTASIHLELPEGEPVKLEVSPAGGKPQRLVVAVRGDVEFRDRINTDSSVSRDRFIKKLAAKLGIDREVLAPLVDSLLTKLAGEIDHTVGPGGAGNEDEEQSQATIAANLALEWELWHTVAKEALCHDPHRRSPGNLGGSIPDCQTLSGQVFL